MYTVRIELFDTTYIVHFINQTNKPSIQQCRSRCPQVIVDYCETQPNKTARFVIHESPLQIEPIK